MFESLVALNNNFLAKTTKSVQFPINFCENVSLVTCMFYSFDDMFLDEIIHVQSLKAMSMYEYLLANVLNNKIDIVPKNKE